MECLPDRATEVFRQDEIENRAEESHKQTEYRPVGEADGHGEIIPWRAQPSAQGSRGSGILCEGGWLGR